MLKGLLVILVLLAAAVYGFQERARCTLSNEDRLPEYYWAYDFQAPAECEDTAKHFNSYRADALVTARCTYSTRFRTWWLMLQNLALVQAPASPRAL